MFARLIFIRQNADPTSGLHFSRLMPILGQKGSGAGMTADKLAGQYFTPGGRADEFTGHEMTQIL